MMIIHRCDLITDASVAGVNKLISHLIQLLGISADNSAYTYICKVKVKVRLV